MSDSFLMPQLFIHLYELTTNAVYYETDQE